MAHDPYILLPEEPVLVTGAAGFIGSRLVVKLAEMGFRDIRCLVRPARKADFAGKAQRRMPPGGKVEVIRGNLLSREDCARAVQGVAVIYHLAASTDKTFPGSVLGNAVAARNLLDAAVDAGSVKRFVNVSSLAVYSNRDVKRGGVVDEGCPLESDFVDRNDPYGYAKALQEELVENCRREHGLPFVHVRPGVVYGPGSHTLSARVGIDTFGVFFHLGGRNRIPITHVDNCAEAILLAGLKPGIDGEAFNVVDDDLPTSRRFLARHKKSHGSFRSVRVPYPVFYLLSWAWESYARWSKYQVPPAFSRRRCAFLWKGNRYSNAKIKRELGWRPRVRYADTAEARA